MTDRVSARAFLAPLFDGFAELPSPAGAVGDGPIAWEGYASARDAATRRTGESESVVCGVGRLGEVAAVVSCFEFGYLGGSIGERTGERIVAAHEHARRHRLPVLSLIATGGSRMQEGMRALSQLQRIVRQATLTRHAGLPQLAVLRDPATGGGWAVLGPSADVILALPGAQVGFAGSRVRPAGADPSAYTAESQLACGHVDAIVSPEALRDKLSRWLRLLGGASGGGAGAGDVAGEVPRDGVAADAADDGTAASKPPLALGDRGPVDAAAVVGRGASVASGTPFGVGGGGRSASGGSPVVPAPVPVALGRTDLPETGWEAVARARDSSRPRASSYLDEYFDWLEPISGDRVGGVDAGLLCGFGSRGGRTIGYVAQTGAATTPAGFRTAARLVRTADRLSIPVLTLIDTPGAANDAEAERAGAGAAIADLFTAVAEADVPITSLLIGEGGSGGAMALAAPGNTWATPDSYFAVIAPEAATSILKRPAEAVGEVADRLRLRPQDLLELGVIRGIAVGDG